MVIQITGCDWQYLKFTQFIRVRNLIKSGNLIFHGGWFISHFGEFYHLLEGSRRTNNLWKSSVYESTPITILHLHFLKKENSRKLTARPVINFPDQQKSEKKIYLSDIMLGFDNLNIFYG